MEEKAIKQAHGVPKGSVKMARNIGNIKDYYSIYSKHKDIYSAKALLDMIDNTELSPDHDWLIELIKTDIYTKYPQLKQQRLI